MARIREEFDFRGKRYKSINSCLKSSGCTDRHLIREERTNVKKIRCESDIVIDKSTRKNNPSDEAKIRNSNRVAVEEMQQRKLIEKQDSFDDWCMGL